MPECWCVFLRTARARNACRSLQIRVLCLNSIFKIIEYSYQILHASCHVKLCLRIKSICNSVTIRNCCGSRARKFLNFEGMSATAATTWDERDERIYLTLTTNDRYNISYVCAAPKRSKNTFGIRGVEIISFICFS